MTTPEMSVEEAERIITTDSQPATAPQPSENNPLKLKAYVSPSQLRKDVEVNPNDLDNAMARHASMFVHYAVQCAAARRQLARAEAVMDILESRLYAHHRSSLMNNAPMVEDSKGKSKKAAVTEPQVEAAKQNDPRWWSAKQKVIDARMIFDLANDARKAFEDRKDMLVQMAVDRRTEREGQLRMQVAQNAPGRDAALIAERQRLAG